MNLTDIWDQLVKTFRSTMAIFGGILLILLITWVVSKINKAVPHSTIKHSTKGFFKVFKGGGEKPHLASGGHTSKNLRSISAHHDHYLIQKTFDNGVRLGKVFPAKKEHDRKDFGHTWFPQSWKDRDVKRAGLAILLHPKFWFKKKGANIKFVGRVGDVNIGVKADDGIAKTIYPIYNQTSEEKLHIEKVNHKNGK
jgi:hypothetical protein